MTRPGDRLRRFAAIVCGPETMARLVDPIVADLQAEYESVAGDLLAELGYETGVRA